MALLLRPLVPAVGADLRVRIGAPVDTGGTVPYAVFFLSGYLPVRLFQSALRYVPRSLTWSQSLMRRTYFPRLLVPLAGFGTTFIEFGRSAGVFAVVVVMTVGRGEPFPLHLGWQTLWLLPCLAARCSSRWRSGWCSASCPVLPRRHLLAALLRHGLMLQRR